MNLRRCRGLGYGLARRRSELEWASEVAGLEAVPEGGVLRGARRLEDAGMYGAVLRGQLRCRLARESEDEGYCNEGRKGY